MRGGSPRLGLCWVTAWFVSTARPTVRCHAAGVRLMLTVGIGGCPPFLLCFLMFFCYIFFSAQPPNTAILTELLLTWAARIFILGCAQVERAHKAERGEEATRGAQEVRMPATSCIGECELYDKKRDQFVLVYLKLTAAQICGCSGKSVRILENPPPKKKQKKKKKKKNRRNTPPRYCQNFKLAAKFPCV